MRNEDRIERALEGLLSEAEWQALQAEIVRDPELRAAWDAHLASGGEIVVCGSHALVGRLRAQVLGEAVDRAELSDPVRRG